MRRCILFLSAGMIAAAICGLLWLIKPLEGDNKRDRSIADVYTIALACQAYRLHSGGAYPSQLRDLTHPPFGGKPFLDSEESLIHSWGMPYRYAVVPDEAGELELYVWAEEPDENRVLMHGVKIRADGVRLRFEGRCVSAAP